jgi:hypothetical protein
MTDRGERRLIFDQRIDVTTIRKNARSSAASRRSDCPFAIAQSIRERVSTAPFSVNPHILSRKSHVPHSLGGRMARRPWTGYGRLFIFQANGRHPLSFS